MTIVPPPRLGNLGEALTEALAWLHSSATISHEIAFLTQQQALGDRSHETAAQLNDWRTVKAAQRRLLGEGGEG